MVSEDQLKLVLVGLDHKIKTIMGGGGGGGGAAPPPPPLSFAFTHGCMYSVYLHPSRAPHH